MGAEGAESLQSEGGTGCDPKRVQCLVSVSDVAETELEEAAGNLVRGRRGASPGAAEACALGFRLRVEVGPSATAKAPKAIPDDVNPDHWVKSLLAREAAEEDAAHKNVEGEAALPILGHEA